MHHIRLLTDHCSFSPLGLCFSLFQMLPELLASGSECWPCSTLARELLKNISAREALVLGGNFPRPEALPPRTGHERAEKWRPVGGWGLASSKTGGQGQRVGRSQESLFRIFSMASVQCQEKVEQDHKTWVESLTQEFHIQLSFVA